MVLKKGTDFWQFGSFDSFSVVFKSLYVLFFNLHIVYALISRSYLIEKYSEHFWERYFKKTNHRINLLSSNFYDLSYIETSTTLLLCSCVNVNTLRSIFCALLNLCLPLGKLCIRHLCLLYIYVCFIDVTNIAIVLTTRHSLLLT